MPNPTTQIRIRVPNITLAKFQGLSCAARSEAIGLILRAVLDGIDPVQLGLAKPLMERLLVQLQSRQEPSTEEIKILIDLLRSKTE